MPTSKKSTKNVVSTIKGRKFRVQSNGFVKEVRSNGYVSTVHIINRIFNNLYRYGIGDIEITIGYGKRSYDSFTASRTLGNGFKIGCYEFDAKNAKKFFRLTGVKNTLINRAFPTAQAAAAGR